MDFNTLLYRLGIDPDCFINKLNEPIKTGNGFIYEVEQRKDERSCPYCGSKKAYVQGYRYVQINCSETDQMRDILRIKKVRFRCKGCDRTYTNPINGIERHSRVSLQTVSMIVKDFTKKITFKDIGIRYGFTTARILQIFDEKIKYVPRRPMPFVLCIDEIRFKGDHDQNYCCVLYDFERREITDIIANRQLAYLEEYFKGIRESERNHTKYFVSDMYDGYRTVRRKYFPRALHIIDLFHVISQMTRAVNMIRVKAMKRVDEDSLEYRFMKNRWKLFLSRREDIPDKFYTSRKTGEIYHYDDLVFRCILKDKDLLEAYNALQDLYHYNQYFFTFEEALRFIDGFADRLVAFGDETLETVGYTYRKWAVEIANGLAGSQSGRHYTNGIAESINNHLKTIIKTAYGYHNFERFRKRAMMIITYKKDME